MNVNPKVAEYWNRALTHFKKAEQCSNEGNYDRVKKESIYAVSAGMLAINELFEVGRGENDIAFTAWYDFGEDIKAKHYSSKEIIEKTRKTLNSFANLSPPADKLSEV